MKKVFFAGLFALIAASSFGQTMLQKPVLCAEISKIFTEITGSKYKELPGWVGLSNEDNGNYVLLVNEKTQTWTFIQFEENIACILATGNRFDFKKPKASD